MLVSQKHSRLGKGTRHLDSTTPLRLYYTQSPWTLTLRIYHLAQLTWRVENRHGHIGRCEKLEKLRDREAFSIGGTVAPGAYIWIHLRLYACRGVEFP